METVLCFWFFVWHGLDWWHRNCEKTKPITHDLTSLNRILLNWHEVRATPTCFQIMQQDLPKPKKGQTWPDITKWDPSRNSHMFWKWWHRTCHKQTRITHDLISPHGVLINWHEVTRCAQFQNVLKWWHRICRTPRKRIKHYLTSLKLNSALLNWHKVCATPACFVWKRWHRTFQKLKNINWH